ncbi:hypothetical protein Btru_028640 [Bulinus truncatus]|nr:hypothetical protein Btru_028640 [Bulinus truncatus]
MNACKTLALNATKEKTMKKHCDIFLRCMLRGSFTVKPSARDLIIFDASFKVKLGNDQCHYNLKEVADDMWDSARAIELTAEDSYNFPHEIHPKETYQFKTEDDNTKYDNVIYKSDGIVIPDYDVLTDMSWGALSKLYHSYLSKNQVVCHDVLRLGRVTDGGWDTCMDSPYKPAAPCTVYSFGIADDFSFDNAVVDKLDCSVHSFDPSIDVKSNQRGEKKYFYKMGIADSDRTLNNGWPMSKLETIRASLKHLKTPITILKLDIEEWEWEVLPDLLTSDQLKTVNQLLMEFHQCDGCSKYNPEQPDKEPPKERYIHMLQLLRQLHQQNFRIFHHHDNKACRYLSKFTMTELTACKEIGFVRVS